MNLTKSILLLFAFIYSHLAWGQEKPEWNQKKCAVVLTYDDGLNVHLDHVVPALDSLNLKGTFFLILSSPGFTKRLQEWKKVAQNKHELANHTLFHPCTGSLPGRSFVPADYNLATYSVRRMDDEIRMANTVLETLDGKKERTFAYPCGDTKIGDSSYLDPIKSDFVAARGVQPVMLQKNSVDLYNMGSYAINGQSGDELIALVKKAMQTHSLLIFLFHGVGGEHNLNVSLEAHSKLLHFLKAQEKDIWVTTFIEAAKYIKATSSEKATGASALK